MLALVLHAHLPYVRHPEQEGVAEERWLFEAITESYLPLVDMLLRLHDEGLKVRLTLSISPTLSAMLRDPLLMERYGQHLENLTELLNLEARRAKDERWTTPLVEFYRRYLERAKALWAAVEGDLIGAYSTLEEAGVLELITTAATHAYLPLVRPKPFAKAQIALGLEHHELLFGHRPQGFWLPECGYSPGIEDVLADLGVTHLFLDTHGLTRGEPMPKYGIHAPVVFPDEQVICFARDPECSRQVWSSTEGYPADPVYREFFRDIGAERRAAELGRMAPAKGSGWLPTGLKYHRITGATEDKEPYDPAVAAGRARAHARHFIEAREAQMECLSGTLDIEPIVIAPFDAELFGHWWFEGPLFLEEVLRRLANQRSKSVELVTPSDYLTRQPRLQVQWPSASSWGQGGLNQVWLSEEHSWAHRHLRGVGRAVLSALHNDGERFGGGLGHRAMAQALRELLLAQSSDWFFLIRAGTAQSYAEQRLRGHLGHALALVKQIQTANVNEGQLTELEQKNPLFQGIDIVSSVYSSTLGR